MMLKELLGSPPYVTKRKVHTPWVCLLADGMASVCITRAS